MTLEPDSLTRLARLACRLVSIKVPAYSADLVVFDRGFPEIERPAVGPDLHFRVCGKVERASFETKRAELWTERRLQQGGDRNAPRKRFLREGSL